MEKAIKDIHTEFCCKIHGCMCGDSNCSVASGFKNQKYYCRYCYMFGVTKDLSKLNPRYGYGK